MKIFLDDVRFPARIGRGWTIVRNWDDFVYTWEVNKDEVTHISFDHDIGPGPTGYDALKLVEEDVLTHVVTNPIVLNVHSMNPVGYEKMKMIIDKLHRLME